VPGVSGRRARARPRRERFDRLRARQESGGLPAEVDPACLTVMLMATAMATISLPHVIAGVCGVDPRDPEFVRHYAEQVAIVAGLLGLD
jgi:TetR/AcrR family transcriptional regulator